MRAPLHVVLVRPKYATNVGAVARAMANLGAQRLILLAPRCQLNSKARQGAAGAQSKLSSTIIYSSWEEFYANEGSGVRIAFTRRNGKRRKAQELKETLSHLEQTTEIGLNQPIYLIFGPEDNGLAVEDMAFINFACTLPVFGDFASYNLAQAALLALYIIKDHFQSLHELKTTQAEPEAEKRLFFPDLSIREWLIEMGFDIKARKASAYVTLRRMLLQNAPTDQELMVLEAILRQNIRKLREYKEQKQDSEQTL